MVRALFSDMLEGKVGSEVLDPYKRKVGVLVGFTSELDGRVTKIEVMLYGSGQVRDYTPEAIEISNGIIIVKPEWKTKAEKTTREYEKAAKRFEGLRELYNKKEIPPQIYKEYAKRLEKRMKALREQIAQVKEMIKKRMSELEDERLLIIRTKTELKMLLMSGDIMSTDYTKAMERLREQEQIIQREMKDLEETLKRLEDIEVRSFSISEEEKKASKANVGEDKLDIPTGTSPIPVKIIE